MEEIENNDKKLMVSYLRSKQFSKRKRNSIIFSQILEILVQLLVFKLGEETQNQSEFFNFKKLKIIFKIDNKRTSWLIAA